MRMGLSRDEAIKAFQDAAYRAAEERAWVDIKSADPYALARYKKSIGNTQPTAVRTRQDEIKSLVGGNMLKTLADSQNTTPEKLAESPELLAKAYQDVYTGASGKGMEGIRDLIRSQTANISETEAYQMLNPTAGAKDYVTVQTKDGIPRSGLRMNGAQNVALLSPDGIPVAEVGKELWANQNGELMKALRYGVGDKKELGISKLSSDTISKVIEKYGDLISDFQRSLDSVLQSSPGVFVSDGTVSAFGRSSGTDLMMNGKLYVTDKQFDAAIAAIQNNYPGISKSTIKTILTEGTGGNTHQIATRRKDTNVSIGTGTDKVDVNRQFYEINISYPTTPANLMYYEQNRGKDWYGTKYNRADYPSYVNSSYSDNGVPYGTSAAVEDEDDDDDESDSSM
jgi:hypothetical protein